MVELRPARQQSGFTHSGSLLLQGQSGLFFSAGDSLALLPVNSVSQPQRSGSWRSFLRDSFPGGVADLGDPTHRGRKNHMDRSMLCRRGLVNLISQEHSWLL